MAEEARTLASPDDERYVPTLAATKAVVKDFYEQHHGQIVDYVDLATALAIPLPLIVNACEELEREGKIAGVD